MLKRKLDELDESIDEDESSSCSTNTNSSADVPNKDISGKRVKKKKSVQFDGVTVYYFSRIQGFTCVPSEGGATLGMSSKHVHQQSFSLQEHAKEQKRLHQLYIEEQRKQGKTIPEFLDSKSDEEDLDDDDSDLDEIDEYYFLQPLSVKQRRSTLRQSGVKKIDGKEKEHCADIRQSREQCGCDCKIFCDPESCACSLAGIQCQVDRLSFPCGCSKDGCGNLRGRIEFNPIRVRTHYVHTVMRLKLEKQDDEVSPVPCQSRYSSKEDGSESHKVPNGTPSEVHAATIAANDQRDIDLTEFNSNELGSCRDCQNPEVCNIMMQEVQYAAMEAEQQRAALHNLYSATQQYKNIVEDSNNSPNSTSLPRVLLFNDNEEDLYNAENTTTFFNFKSEENSYSENSECSSEGSTGYEGAEYPKTYQTLTSYEVNADNANQGYHMQSQQGVYAQNNPKFMTMNTAHQMYKVSSHPEVMDAVQTENTYNTYNHTNWNSKETASYENKERNTQSSASSTCSYTTMTNTTCDKIAEACPSISSHINNNSQDSCDDLKMNNYAGMDSFHCGTSMVEEKTYLNMGENTVSTLQNEQNHPSNSLHKNHINNLANNVIPISEQNMGNSTSTFANHVTKSQDQLDLDISHAKESSCPHSGQNFGEIIKESIFETVSA